MQTHPCVICKKDSFGGGSMVHGGMFFKLCSDCLEDKEAVKMINEYLMDIEIEESAKNDLADEESKIKLQ